MVLPIYDSPLHFFLTKLTTSIKVIQIYLLTIFEKGYEKFITNLYASCGIEINGKNPWDIQVLDKRFYKHVAIYSNKGLGEAYMEGYWTCKDMPEMFKIVLSNGITRFMTTRFHRVLNFFNYHLFNMQTKAKAWEVGQKHYDIGNEVFKSFLDKTMTYSCGYWKNAKNVDEAQEHKMELIARKLHLKPGMKVLDIGCGWGGLCYYLAKNYGVSVVGITISKEGAKTASELCKDLPVEIRLIDYRDLNENFDRIVSVGMFEHVGEKNYRTFFEVANRCLIDQGIFLLHSIGSNDPEMPLTEGFFDTYIFRNGVLPYVTAIPKYTEGLFIIEDWHNFGYDYYRTLEAWSKNFNKNWPTIENKMGEKFKRMWNYYLTVSGAAFRARRTQLWQVVLTKNGLDKGYVSVR